MTDWQPTSFTPSNGDWDKIIRLQLILQDDSVFYGRLNERSQSGDAAQLAMAGAAVNPGWGGLLGGASSIGLQSQIMSHADPYGQPLTNAGSAIDVQQGMVDFVRYFFPGGNFDPGSASEAFHLGQFLLDLFTRILTFPGGAVLAYSILTSLHRQVPALGAYLNQESDLSLFEALDSRLGKLIRKLLGGIDAVPIPTPSVLQGVEHWIHSVAVNYRALEASGVFDEPDLLSRLFRRVSDQMNESVYPGQKAGWTGVVFYTLGLVFEEVDAVIAERLYETGDLFFKLSETFNLWGELRHLQHIGSVDDLFRVINEVPLTPLDVVLTSVDGIIGLFDYFDSVAALWADPSLNPYLAGDEVWPRRISVMFEGIEGIISAGSAVITIASGGAVLSITPILVVAMTICGLIILILNNWDWLSNGLQAWRDSWNMLTHIIIPYRLHQSWQWFDDNLGRPVREHIIQPIRQWANQAWNGLSGLVQSLAGD